jgi:hypothetical protein
MKIIDVQQGSPEWIKARLGIPTASEFHRIVTAARGDLSKSARKYAFALVAETLMGKPLEKPPLNTFAMERGRMLEPIAIQQYEFITDAETKLVGFITTDDGRVGCSPDRLIVGTRGAVEVKCRLDEGHMAILIDGPEDDFKQQVQGQLAVAELSHVDLFAYHPDLPPALIRVERDEPYIAKMSAALREFLDMRDEMLVKARASGFFANDNRVLIEAA